MGLLCCTFELHLFDNASSADAAVSVKDMIKQDFESNKDFSAVGANQKSIAGNGATNGEPSEQYDSISQPFDSKLIAKNGQYRINMDTLPQCLVFNVAVHIPKGATSESLKLKFRRMLEKVDKLQFVKELRNFPFTEHGIETLQKFFGTSDGRMIEYEFKRLIFSKQSKFQVSKFLTLHAACHAKPA